MAVASARTGSASPVSDNYWADFLFGNTNNYSLANYFVAHLRQTMDNAYAQDDWKVNSKLTLNLGLRWEYGSPYSEENNYISNFDPTTQTVLTITPGAVAGNGITPYSGGGVYGHTLINPDLKDFAPRVGFAYAATPIDGRPRRLRHELCALHARRFGRHPGDQRAAGAVRLGDADCPLTTPTTAHPLPAQIIAPGTTTPSCYATADQGFPSALVTHFQSGNRQHHLCSEEHPGQLRRELLPQRAEQLSKNTLVDIAYVGNHGVQLQGFVNANQKNPVVSGLCAAVCQLAERYHRGAQRVLLQLQLAAGEV